MVHIVTTLESIVPNSLHMLEYLEYAGIDIKPLVNETAIEKEYFRQIYRVDSRDKVLGKKEGRVRKSRHPRLLN